MRVLLTVHHRLNPDQGAPGATMALGAALADLGCEVEFFDFQKAFPNLQADDDVKLFLRFPWQAARFLKTEAHRFDVIDATTGDSWVWAARGRPGAKAGDALVTRSHGLEHIVDRSEREFARKNNQPLSWKYPLYHGGFRLWEVARSLRLADHCFLLNEEDAQFARDRLKIDAARISVTPNGVRDLFFDGPPAKARPVPPLRLAFVGSWVTRKGIVALTDAVARLAAVGMELALSCYGTGASEATVRAAFTPEVQERVHVTPLYRNEDLPGLLAEHDILLFPSLAEGFGLALIEAMACGLAPISTPVGIAPQAIRSGENGRIIPLNDGEALANAARELAANPDGLLAMRRQAQATAQAYRWRAIAEKTLATYERTRGERRPA